MYYSTSIHADIWCVHPAPGPGVYLAALYELLRGPVAETPDGADSQSLPSLQHNQCDIRPQLRGLAVGQYTRQSVTYTRSTSQTKGKFVFNFGYGYLV